MEEECLSVVQAAKLKKVSRQAIYTAIRLNRLRAHRHGDRVWVLKSDLDKYNENLFSRVKHSMHQGERIFDESKGLFAVQDAAKMINLPKQKLYYAIRTKLLKSEKKNGQYVIHIDDLMHFQQTVLNKNFTEETAGV